MRYSSVNALLAALFLSTSVCAPANPLVAQEKAPLCLPIETTKPASVVILGTYRGELEPIVQAGKSKDSGDPMQAYDQVVRVRGGYPNQDIVLVLGSIENLTWDLSGLAPSKLRGVILYGYDNPKIRGLNENIPLRIISRDSPAPECGDPIVAFHGGVVLDALVKQAERVTQLKVTKFIGGYTNSEFDIGISNEAAIDHTLKGSVTQNRGLPQPIPDDWPGDSLVRQLVGAGSIRPATQADIDQWNDAASRKLASHSLSPFVSDYIKTGYTYVVLKQITLPATMHGSSARIFIVPPGVPQPITAGTKPSGNGIYIIADGTCTGPIEECLPGRIGAIGKSIQRK